MKQGLKRVLGAIRGPSVPASSPAEEAKAGAIRATGVSHIIGMQESVVYSYGICVVVRNGIAYLAVAKGQTEPEVELHEIPEGCGVVGSIRHKMTERDLLRLAWAPKFTDSISSQTDFGKIDKEPPKTPAQTFVDKRGYAPTEPLKGRPPAKPIRPAEPDLPPGRGGCCA